MTNKQFLDEIIEYDKERYAFFEKYRKIVVDIFKAFHKVCIDNQIIYYLAFGSLLGAYRGDGFIPWDCDIDVTVPYSELDRLHECLKKDLPDGYYFVSEKTNDDYPYYQMRICKKGYDHGVHVDVFYMYGLPEGENYQKKYVSKVNKLFNKRRKITDTGGKSSSIINKLGKTVLRTFSNVKRMNVRLNQLCTRYPIDNSKHLSVVFHDPLVFPSELFGKPVSFDNGGVEVLVPQKAELFLELRYGDWRSYLPIEERYKEYMTLYNFLLKVEARHNKNKKETDYEH